MTRTLSPIGYRKALCQPQVLPKSGLAASDSLMHNFWDFYTSPTTGGIQFLHSVPAIACAMNDATGFNFEGASLVKHRQLRCFLSTLSVKT